MISIGRFAQLSGLSVKALRHYDETGLLEPAHVDPESGYRWYRPGQARQGATISVLRSMGVPLEVVRQVLSEPERGEEHLQRWLADLRSDRARQDEAVEAGLLSLKAYERDAGVVRRQAPEQHYLGVVLDPDALDGDPQAGAALMEAGWQEVHVAVTEAGGSASTAWTTIRPQDGGEPGQVLLCLGLDDPWPAGRATSRFEAGTLPERTELVVVLAPDDMPPPQALGEAAPPARLIALMEELDREEATPETIRQTPLLDAEAFAGLEISVSLSRPG